VNKNFTKTSKESNLAFRDCIKVMNITRQTPKKGLLKWLVSLTALLLSTTSFAQPSNDNCGGAIVLNPSNSCNPVSGTTAGATQSQPGTLGSANDDVWYSFVANAPQLMVQVTGSTTFNAVVQVYSGTCGGSSLTAVNNTGNGGTEYANLPNLFVGVTYWIRVHHFASTLSSNPTFTICVTAPITEPTCDPNSPEPSNTMNPCSGVPKICQVNGFCGTTQGYHATPGATTLTPYTADHWAQLNTAFCGSIENNSFMYFTASQSSVQLRVYGTCSGGGNSIQMMIFSLNSPVPGTCDNGPVTTYGCYGSMNVNGSPNGVPISFTGMTPGQNYYIMVDGNAGSICNYKIGADYGVQVSANISASSTSICLGNNVTLTASGGNGVYAWDPNPDLSSTTGSPVIATPTTTGAHSYVVSSPSSDPSCPGSGDTVVINVSDVPTPDAGIDDTVCFGQPITLNGTLSNSANSKLWQYIAPPGTSPSVQFSPNYSVLNPTVNVNLPGLYRFILRETNTLCGQYRDTMSMLVLDPTQTLSGYEPSCFGLNDGSISVVSSFADEYSYDDGATWVATDSMSGFASGSYVVCSRNYLGCSVCDTVVVPDGVQMGLTVSPDTLICENGTATLNAVGVGGTGIQYHWSFTNDSVSPQPVSPSAPGYYSVFASNSDGCQSGTDSIYVDLRDPISGTLTPDVTICPGDNATLTAVAADGIGSPYNYAWSEGSNGSGPTNSIIVSPNATTTYSVSITDNCESTPLVLQTDVIVSPIPQPIFSTPVDSVCEPATFVVFNNTDPTYVDNVTWELSDGSFFSEQDSIVLTNLPHGGYDLSLTVVSPDGCVNTTTVTKFLNSMVKPESIYRFSPSPVTMFNTKVEFTNLSGSGATNYEWFFEGASPSYSAEVNPTVQFPDGTVGNYAVDLVSYTDFGCSDTITQVVEVLSEVIAYIPNTFTPDGDQHNQTWKLNLAGIDVSEFNIRVFDRWGHLIWESNNPEAEWDGTYRGKVVPEGSYSWVIVAKDALNSNENVWQGTVTVLK
jgi:gliding motility-associated-like protein